MDMPWQLMKMQKHKLLDHFCTNLIWKKIDLTKPIDIKNKIDVIIHCAVIHEFSKNKKIL